MGCNGSRFGMSISHPSVRLSGRKGAPTAQPRLQRGAIVQMAWEASQQLLTGTVRDAGGEIRTVSASFRASPGFPFRFREGYCSCATGTNCVHVAALVLAATDETLLPTTGPMAATAARRSALPWEQPLDSLLATPQPAGTPAASDVTAGRAARGRAVACPGRRRARPLPQLQHGQRPLRAASRGPSAQAQAPGAAGAARPARRLGGRHPDLVKAGLPAAARRDTRRADQAAAGTARPLPGEHRPAVPLLRQLFLRRVRRREVPGPVRLRVQAAVANPRPGIRGGPALPLPGQAGHRAAAGHRGAVPGRDDRRHHPAYRPGDQDGRRRGRGSAQVRRQRGPRRDLRRPRGGQGRRTEPERPVPGKAEPPRADRASSPGSGSPGSPIRCRRSCSSWR